MLHSKHDEDEEMNLSMSSTGLIREQGNKEGGAGGAGGQEDVPFCGCLTVRYYQPYFDVDTADVSARITSAIFYCRAGTADNFLATTAEKPDAYGPFWVATSLVFVVAVSSHVSSWLTSWMSGKNWEYNFESVVTSASIVYGFAAGAPLVMYLILGQYGARFKLISAVCLYGYSLSIYILAAVRLRYDCHRSPARLMPYSPLFSLHSLPPTGRMFCAL